MAKKIKLENFEATFNRKLTAAEAYANRPRFWMLYTLITLIIVAMVSWSSADIQFTGLTVTGTEVAKGVLHGIFGPDTKLLFGLGDTDVPYLLLQTMAIAILGTLIGAILAIPFAFLAATNIMPKPIAYLFRVLILLIRTIPSLVWALVWIRVTGPNAFCGVVTQSVCSIGMISKMYITAIEDIDVRILESLDASGCTTFQKIRYGILPQIIPNFISTVIYRFDINVKDATTLGIVGAGGIGAALVQCINSSRWSMVGAYLCGMVILMFFIELGSTKIRNKLTRGQEIKNQGCKAAGIPASPCISPKGFQRATGKPFGGALGQRPNPAGISHRFAASFQRGQSSWTEHSTSASPPTCTAISILRTMPILRIVPWA